MKLLSDEAITIALISPTPPETTATVASDLVKLTPSMNTTAGAEEIAIELIDGPVVMDHPDLATEQIRQIAGGIGGSCAELASTACMNGTFVAGICSVGETPRHQQSARVALYPSGRSFQKRSRPVSGFQVQVHGSGGDH